MDPLNGGIEFKLGMKKLLFLTGILLSGVVRVPLDRAKLMTLITGRTEGQHLLITGDG